MNKPHITIHDMARELGISASTVSRALKDHPRISESTREAVKKLARRYNYQPNVMASSLRQGRSQTVGVIVPRINRNFFAHVIGGMEEVLAAAGYHLMICQTLEKEENEISALETLVHARVDAIILSVAMEIQTGKHLAGLRKKGVRLFFFDRVLEDLHTGAVVVDDRLGAYLNVKHLLDQGYRKIMHVAGAGHISIYHNRRQGYLDAMQEAGLEVPSHWIIENTLVLEDGVAAYHRAMELEPGTEAFFCAGDFAALGVMQAGRQAGRNIPEDLGVTGFANEPFTAYLSPSLTTVDQRGPEMGRKVAEMFLNCEMQGVDPGSCGTTTLQPELIIRESSTKKQQ